MERESLATESNGTGAEHSVSSSLEHLVAGSQGVITKRIDLALLEGRELLSRSIERAALGGAAMVLAAAAWFAVVASVVLWATPGASVIVRAAAFAAVNAAGAAALVTVAMRLGRPPHGHERAMRPALQPELSTNEGKNGLHP